MSWVYFTRCAREEQAEKELSDAQQSFGWFYVAKLCARFFSRHKKKKKFFFQKIKFLQLNIIKIFPSPRQPPKSPTVVSFHKESCRVSC